jgi:hypothetical protein
LRGVHIRLRTTHRGPFVEAEFTFVESRDFCDSLAQRFDA